MRQKRDTIDSEFLWRLAGRRLIVRAKSESRWVEIRLLAGVKVNFSDRKRTLIELNFYRGPDWNDEHQEPKVELFFYSNAKDREARLKSLLYDWENHYSHVTPENSDWREPKEVVISCSSMRGWLDLPSYNAFFLQEMAGLRMWLTMAIRLHPQLTDCPLELLKVFQKRVVAFMKDQGEELGEALVLAEFPSR